MDKSQSPNPKSQKNQFESTLGFGFWDLGFDWSPV
jgi:hypothetical protein